MFFLENRKGLGLRKGFSFGVFESVVLDPEISIHLQFLRESTRNLILIHFCRSQSNYRDILVENVSHFIEYTPECGRLLKTLSNGGERQVFLLTNSDYFYANVS